MIIPDEFCKQYMNFLDGTYDCMDRIVLNAYFCLGQSPAGFRFWWRILMGGDDTLDNTHLMRFAGRFSRRIHAYAEEKRIPLIPCERDQRKHEIAEQYIPTDPHFRGVFCILIGRGPAPVFDIKQFANGGIDIHRKTPLPYVNHYFFHIMDPEWGHVTIRLCPHPPFNAQIILNGHEYIAKQAEKENISFTKEGNCFTGISDAAGLARIADTMKDKDFVGRLVQVCERWIYSTCLCFALSIEEQNKSGFHYSYSVYQAEYSRNLLFTRGHTMEQVFESVIDRTRAPLNIKTTKTIFGYKHRPFKKNKQGKTPRFEVVVERPVYNLTVFKVHFGKLTAKIYSKGERVLRIETIAHNTADLRCGKGIDKFPKIAESLKLILEKFLCALRSIDASFVDFETLETWPIPSKVGATRVGGIDVNQPRIRTVMEALIALSINHRGFTASDLAKKVKEITNASETDYRPRQASYDLKKFRGKELVYRVEKSRRYRVTENGLKSMAAFFVLHQKILKPLLAGAGKRKTGPKPTNQCEIDLHYKNIQIEMQKIFKILKIAA
jgi:DNA-binding transcriptional ArsR family regulator